MTRAQAHRAPPDPEELLANAEHGLRLAQRLGADDAELYLWHGRRSELMQSHRTRALERSDRSGVSARIVMDGRVTFAKTSGLRGDEIEWVVRRAVRSAGFLPVQDRSVHLAPGADAGGPPSPVHPDLVDLDPRRLREAGDEVAEAAYGSATPNHFRERFVVNEGLFAVANTRGVRAWDQHAHESFLVEVRCNEGDTHKTARAFRAGRGPLNEDHDLGAVAEAAVERALKATETRQLDDLVHEVILDGSCTATLLDKVLPSMDGRAMDQKRSVFAGRLGEPVAAQSLTIIDRPQGPYGCRHQRVDDEGVPTRQRPLIRDGVLEGVVYDAIGAQEAGEDPPGNGLRALTDRYGGGPSPAPVNPVMEPGRQTLDELVAAADRAVLIQDPMLGSFTVEPLSGEFSLVAPLAFLVEDGEVTDSLESASFSGNLFEALTNIEALGSERVDYTRGSFVPMHLSGVTCAT